MRRPREELAALSSFWKCERRMECRILQAASTTSCAASCTIYARMANRLVDFFRDQYFAEFQDAKLKRLKWNRIGSKKHQAEPLTIDEEILWKMGNRSPQALLNAVFCLNGVCFALCSDDEHQHLRYRDSHARA